MILRTFLMVVLLVVAGAAAAFDPREGTEVLLVDPDGQSILGFGRIRDGSLDLQLSPATGEFTLMLLQEDGSIEVFGGRREGIERLEILDPETGLHTLTSLLSEAGFALEVTLLPGFSGDSPSDRDGNPGERFPVPTPDDDGPEDDGNDDDDGDDDDGEDDDDDDEADDGEDTDDDDGDDGDDGDDDGD